MLIKRVERIGEREGKIEWKVTHENGNKAIRHTSKEDDERRSWKFDEVKR